MRMRMRVRVRVIKCALPTEVVYTEAPRPVFFSSTGGYMYDLAAVVGKTCRRRQSMNRRGAGAGGRSTFLEGRGKEGRAGGLRVVCFSLGRRGKSSSSKDGRTSVEKRCDLYLSFKQVLGEVTKGVSALTGTGSSRGSRNI